VLARTDPASSNLGALLAALLVVFGCKKALEIVYRELVNHP
jgi:hypothetical protein